MHAKMLSAFKFFSQDLLSVECKLSYVLPFISLTDILCGNVAFIFDFSGM
jgi:hypothetical protein